MKESFQSYVGYWWVEGGILYVCPLGGIFAGHDPDTTEVGRASEYNFLKKSLKKTGLFDSVRLVLRKAWCLMDSKVTIQVIQTARENVVESD